MILIFIFSVITLSESRNPFPDMTDERFQTDCLSKHNYYRTLHKTSLLQLNRSIVAYAKTRCSTTSRFEALSNHHNGLVGHGENLYWGGNSEPAVSTCSEAIKLWYDEIKLYDYSNPGFAASTGHFTQLVWNSTLTVGCAICGGKGTKWYETYVVCNYYRPGNVIGQFEQNVFHPKKSNEPNKPNKPNKPNRPNEPNIPNDETKDEPNKSNDLETTSITQMVIIINHEFSHSVSKHLLAFSTVVAIISFLKTL